MKKTREISYMAMYIAMYVVLEYVSRFMPILQMPQGGKLSLSVIPLLLASYHLGFSKALVVAITAVLMRFILIKPLTFVSPLQLALDYFLAYGVYAVAGLFKDVKWGKLAFPIGVIFANVLRYLSHSAAGVLFWNEGLIEGKFMIGSLAYNMPYMVATAVVSFIVVMIIKPRLINN